MSTKNATELPKCSKSLHFVNVARSRARLFVSKRKAKAGPTDMGPQAGLRVKTTGASRFLTGSCRYSSRIWPLRCLTQGATQARRRVDERGQTPE